MTASNEPSRLDEALALLELGFHLLPVHTIRNGQCSCEGKVPGCKPGKHPAGLLVKRGHLGASNSPTRISEWWTEMPDANIGIACGPSGLIVIDEDPRDGGDETLANLKLAGSSLPDTATARTGDGHHYFYRRPEGVPVKDGDLGAGVQLKISGYVVAPPSAHHSGRNYEWEHGSSPFEGVQIADAPDWLVELLRAQKSASRRPAVVTVDKNAVCPTNVMVEIEGNRNLASLWNMSAVLDGQKDVSPSNYRFLLEGQLAAKGFSKQEIVDTAIEFTRLKSKNDISPEGLRAEVEKAFENARQLVPARPLALGANNASSKAAVLAAVEHTLQMHGMPEPAKRLLITMSRYSPDGQTVWVPDTKIAGDMHWQLEEHPRGSRRVRKNKQLLVRQGCITPLTKPAPGNAVKYGLNTREDHPHRRIGESYV